MRINYAIVRRMLFFLRIFAKYSNLLDTLLHLFRLVYVREVDAAGRRQRLGATSAEWPSYPEVIRTPPYGRMLYNLHYNNSTTHASYEILEYT